MRSGGRAASRGPACRRRPSGWGSSGASGTRVLSDSTNTWRNYRRRRRPMTAKGETTMAKTEYVIEPGKQELFITRVFDAPRELVWKVFTDPKLVAQWFGPRKYKTTVAKLEARPGGLWRMIKRDESGNEFA